MRAWQWMASVALAAGLAGCGSPEPINYYTLVPGFDQTRPAASSAVRDAVASSGAVAVQVLPVSLPVELDTSRLLVRTGPGAMVPFNGERWMGQLSDQIRAALSDNLSRKLDLPAVQSDAQAADGAIWRVQIEVQRFESTPQGLAGLEAVWRVRHSDRKDQPPLCHSRLQRQSETADVASLVQAHQANIDSLASEMAAAIATGRCPAAAG